MNYLFTSESVSDGHPDKVADQISDAVLTECLNQDNKSRVAAETLCNTGLVVMAGEITTNAIVDYQNVARNVLKDIGYNNGDYGIDYKSCSVLVAYDKQSQDIKVGVDNNGFDIGAGDQGIMFGYACNETPNFMPAPIMYAHELMKKQKYLRKHTPFGIENLRPDAKSQVTMAYENGVPTYIDTIVLSTQHSPDISQNFLKEYIIEELIKKTIDNNLLINTKYLINPTGRFVVGGPQGDCGLTGRKIIVDTYGGYAPHGGGAFSGKDPTKVDRSGAYMCRYVAKHIVVSGIASKCLIQVSYAIGVSHPTSIFVNTFGTGLISDDKISKLINELFDFRPKSIIEKLNLLNQNYYKSASFGHFGRDFFSWEMIDSNIISKLVK